MNYEGTQRNVTEDDIFIRKSAIETSCGCAASKCGPHRCWPSKLAWASVIALLAWVLVLLSNDAVKVEKHRDQQLRELAENLQQQVNAAIESLQQDTRLNRQRAHDLLIAQIDASVAQAIVAPTQALQDALAKLRHDSDYLNTLRWSLETPETLKYVQLKAAVEACEARSSR